MSDALHWIMGATKGLALLLVTLLLACATTVHDRDAPESTWRVGDSRASTGTTAARGEKIPVYVASFGLAGSVAERYPELADSQVGWGISNRLVEALYDTELFAFREEKAEVMERLVALMRDEASAESLAAKAPEDVRWLLYGEVVDLRVSRTETVAGLRTKAEVETSITIQIRLLDRETQQFLPATATGKDVSRSREARSELDERAVGSATEEAVRRAAQELVAKVGHS